MSKKVPLLEQKITNLEEINRTWEHTDSIRAINEQVLIKNNKRLAKTNKILFLSALASLILCLIK